jgi:hypothetical protein
MLNVLAGDPLAPWAQAAAIILLFYMFLSVFIGLAVALGLMLGLAWTREKVELIKRLRPTVDSVNTASEAAIKGALPPPGANDNKIVHTVAEVPAITHTIEKKVEEGSDRVASAVIEFRARTEMAKTVLKSFFLPGLTHGRPTALLEEGVGFRSPGYRMLVDKTVPGEKAAGPGTGYAGAIRASQLKEAPSGVETSPAQETQRADTEARDVPTR